MSVTLLFSRLTDGGLGGCIPHVAARSLYIDALRGPLFRSVAYGLARPGLWRRVEKDRLGWQKVREQYQAVSLAALHSLNRVVEKRILAPQAAEVVLDLWSKAFLPSPERRNAAQRFRERYGSAPPWFLVLSPTCSCNLSCEGCYANSEPGIRGRREAALPWSMLDRVMTEAKELWGVPLFVFSGGEPLAYRSGGKDLLDVARKHADRLFLMFTNGTLITSETARRLSEVKNLTPCLSVEGLKQRTDERRGSGVFDRVVEAMAHLREVGVPFGISMTATRSNCDHILSDEVLDFFFERQGAFYGFSFPYMPIGRHPDLDWVPTIEQRIAFWERSWEVIRSHRLLLFDFWNHGPLVEGCIASGRERGYMHVDWSGNITPCVFMPYVASNLHEVYGRGGTLNDAWAAPLLREVRAWQRAYGYGRRDMSRGGNLMRPCPVRDHAATLWDWVESLELASQEGVGHAMLLRHASGEGTLAYQRQEEADPLDRLWRKEYLHCI